MIREHPMLRCIILKDGRQQILKKVPPFILDINNLSCFEEDDMEIALKTVRKKCLTK